MDVGQDNLCNRDNHARKWLFSGGVNAGELGTKIVENRSEGGSDKDAMEISLDIPEQSTGFSCDEWDMILMRPIIDF